MGLEAMVSRLRRSLGIAKNVFVGGVFVAGVTGVVYGAYFIVNINSENIRESIALEGNGQKAEYFARAPRNGFLSRIPWNDDDGHAIIKVRNASGSEVMEAFDKNYNGSLADAVDAISVSIGKGKISCYAGKAVDLDGKDVPFVEPGDPLRNAMVTAARGYCSSQRAMAEEIYREVRKHIKAN